MAVARSNEDIGGILLSGGQSRRLGFDKAALLIEDVPLAVRLGEALRAVTENVVEVGRGASGLPFVQETPAGGGPLVAVCAGVVALRQRGHGGGALVVACDLPFMTSSVLAVIAGWQTRGSVVPVVAGRPQPLCARWSASDLETAIRLVADGERSMQALLETSRPLLLDTSDEDGKLPASAFADVDTKEDLARLGIPISRQER